LARVDIEKRRGAVGWRAQHQERERRYRDGAANQRHDEETAPDHLHRRRDAEELGQALRRGRVRRIARRARRRLSIHDIHRRHRTPVFRRIKFLPGNAFNLAHTLGLSRLQRDAMHAPRR